MKNKIIDTTKCTVDRMDFTNAPEYNGIPFISIGGRIQHFQIPKGLYRYSIRHSDDGSCAATLETRVGVNHLNDVLSGIKIDFDKYGGYLEIQYQCCVEEKYTVDELIMESRRVYESQKGEQ